MVAFKKPTERAATAGYDQEARTRARDAFKASVRAMIADRKPFAALGELDDLEMMEAATELTREAIEPTAEVSPKR